MKTKKWYNYLWIWSIVYFALGFFNILFDGGKFFRRNNRGDILHLSVCGRKTR